MTDTGDSVFSNPGDILFTNAQERNWKEIESALRQLTKVKEALLKDVRKRYLEIDINDLSNSAWKHHVQSEREFKAAMKLSV